MSVHHVLISRVHVNGDDVAGHARREGDLAGPTDGAVLGHEQRATTCDALDGSEESAATRMLRMRRHLNRRGHPGEFARLRDDRVVGPESELKYGHRCAENAILHGDPPVISDICNYVSYFCGR